MSKESKLTFTNEKFTIEHVKQVFGVQSINIDKFESGKHGFKCGKLSGPVSSTVDLEKLAADPTQFQVAIALTEKDEKLALLCPIGYQFETVLTV